MPSARLAILSCAASFAWVCAGGAHAEPPPRALSGSSVTLAPPTGATDAAASAIGPGGIPSRAEVHLANVLSVAGVKLIVDGANAPMSVQLPIDVAAEACGMTLEALTASGPPGKLTCAATTAPPALVEAVQQQMAPGGGPRR